MGGKLTGIFGLIWKFWLWWMYRTIIIPILDHLGLQQNRLTVMVLRLLLLITWTTAIILVDDNRIDVDIHIIVVFFFSVFAANSLLLSAEFAHGQLPFLLDLVTGCRYLNLRHFIIPQACTNLAQLALRKWILLEKLPVWVGFFPKRGRVFLDYLLIEILVFLLPILELSCVSFPGEEGHFCPAGVQKGVRLFVSLVLDVFELLL